MSKETYRKFQSHKKRGRRKEYVMIEAMTGKESDIEIGQNREQGRVIIMSGEIGSGKSAIMRILKSLDSEDIGFVVTDTTRKMRNGETEDDRYRDHDYKSKFWNRFFNWEKNYDVAYELAGEKYGLSLDKVKELTQQGKDVFIISPLQGLKKIKEKLASDKDMLPPISILITASKENLEKRIYSRSEPINQKERRIEILGRQREEFSKNLYEFDLIYSNPNPPGAMNREGIENAIDQTFRALNKARLKIREYDPRGLDIAEVKREYVNELIKSMFKSSYVDIISNLRGREEVYLDFNSEIVEEYARRLNKGISDRSLERVKKRRLLLTPNCYGVASFLFEGFQDVNERKMFLDLIEHARGTGPARRRNPSSQYKENSEYGFFRILNGSINDGVIYNLSDDGVREDPNTGLYALSIVLLQPGGRNLEEMLSLSYAPLSKNRIEEMKIEKSGSSSQFLL